MGKIRILVALVIALLAALPAFAQDETPTPSAIVLPEVFDRGLTLFDAEEYQQAILHFSLFLLLNPTASEGYYGAALSHLNLNDVDAALVDLDQALAIDPLPAGLGAELHRLRGSIYVQRQQPDQALSDFSAALELVPEASTYIRRALIYAGQNDNERALADFDAALELDDTNPVPYVYRGFLYSVTGETQLAATDYYTFIQMVQTDVTIGDPLESGSPVTAALAPGQVFAYPVEAKEGYYFSAVAVTTNRNAPIDTLIVLVDQDGSPVIGDDDSGGSGIALVNNFQLSTSGDYTLLVANSTGGGSGEIAVQMYLTEQPLTN